MQFAYFQLIDSTICSKARHRDSISYQDDSWFNLLFTSKVVVARRDVFLESPPFAAQPLR